MNSIELGPIIAAIGLFTFLCLAVVVRARTRERIAFYRSEERKRMIESSGVGGAALTDFLLQEEEITQRRRREGLKLGGLITTAVGVAMFVAFFSIDEEARMAGIIPLLIGAVILFYAYFMAPKPGKSNI